MIQIKTQELRDAVQSAYEFDVEHGKRIDRTERATGNLFHETYEFDGKIRTYYFDRFVLIAYKDAA